MTDDRMDSLAARLLSISDAYSGGCSWAVTDLQSGAHIGHRENDVTPTASLIKAPVLVALYRAVADSKLKLEDRVKYSDEHRSLGSGVLAKMTPGVEMTVRDAAVLMMIISDNSATNICIDLVGLDYINGTMRDLGLQQTTLFRRIGDRSAGLDGRKMSVSTAAEISQLMEMLARHELVSPDASEDMLRIMRRCDYRHELSAELPWNEMNTLGDPRVSWVAEKGGSFMTVRCGGAVFKGPNGYFVMAAFCEGGAGTALETGRKSEGNVTLGRLGKAAWDALAG